MFLQMAGFPSYLQFNNTQLCLNNIFLISLFICQCTLRFPHLGYWEWCCNEHVCQHFLQIVRFQLYTEVRLLDHMAIVFLTFWRISILFSIMAKTIYFTSNKEWGFPFLSNLAKTCVSFFFFGFDKTILIGVGAYLTVVLICISQIIMMLGTFHVPTGNLYVFFGKMSSSSAPFLKV